MNNPSVMLPIDSQHGAVTMANMARREEFLQRLEDTGEAGVREGLRLGRYGADHKGWAELWIEDRDRSRSAEAKASQDELDRLHAVAARDSADAAALQASEAAEANRLARQANDKANTANTIATLAAIAAAISIAVSVIDAFID